MKNVSRPSVVVVRRPSPVVVVRRPFRRRRPLSCPPSVRRPSRRRRPLSVRPVRPSSSVRRRRQEHYWGFRASVTPAANFPRSQELGISRENPIEQALFGE